MITSPNLVRLASDWLNKNNGRPFFLFIHWWDPHCDYIPPSPYDRTFDPYYEGTMDGTRMTYGDKVTPGMDARDLEHVVALYDGEICWTDWHLGKIFDTLEDLHIYNETIIVIVADHGEEFLEHGGKLHARTLYDEVIHVPLVFRIPGMSVTQEIEEVVSVVDITPTVLDILNIDHPTSVDGESLWPIITGARQRRVTSEVYSELEFTHDLTSVVSGPWKLIHHLRSDSYELYNTIEDGVEENNLIDEAPGQASVLSQKLSRWLDVKRGESVAAPRAAPDARTTKDLKALGYIQ
jgi:arylsulfatase A-like enzyme